MNNIIKASRQGSVWFWRLAVAIAATLLALIAVGNNGSALTIGPLGSTTTVPANVHAAVFAFAQTHPGQSVPVIVETSGDSDSVLSAIDLLGGTTEQQFEIIPAIEAELLLGAVVSLASDPSVAFISLDAPIVTLDAPVDTINLSTTYPFSVGANGVWTQGFTGAGVTVAVVDTGVSADNNSDFTRPDGSSRVVASVERNSSTTTLTDGYGHGTHVAGIIGGDGSALNGKYIGISPGANLISVKVADDAGNAAMSDVIAGLQWVFNHRASHDIRVVNLSLHSSVAQSYKTDPLCGAVEFLWLSGVFVVAAAGNSGNAADAVNYCPGNDPFVMTVGATDNLGTAEMGDDVVASFSSRGTTQNGFSKPEILAPGRNIVSAAVPNSVLFNSYPEKVVEGKYFRLSGTSMAAPVVSGIAALMLEHNPSLTPAQLKHILVNTSQPLAGDPTVRSVLGEPSVLFSDIPGNTNLGLTPSRFVRKAFVAKFGLIAYVLGEADPIAAANIVGLDLGAVGATNLDAVKWDAVKWDAVKWDAVKWDAVKWDAIKWDAVKWDAVKWDAVKWDAVKWSAVRWDAVKWDAVKWDAVKWSAVKWDAVTAP